MKLGRSLRTAHMQHFLKVYLKAYIGPYKFERDALNERTWASGSSTAAYYNCNPFRSPDATMLDALLDVNTSPRPCAVDLRSCIIVGYYVLEPPLAMVWYG